MIVVFILAAFDLYLWRYFPRAITKRPNLHGTWKAKLESTWVSGETGEAVSKHFYLVVRQTFSSITVTSLYDIARSQSTSAGLAEHNGTCELSYIYWSAAKTTKRTGNPPHRGAAALVISSEPTLSMAGDYWTERDGGKGTIATLGRSKKIYDSFDAAEEGVYV
jgi:hypothetical protein